MIHQIFKEEENFLITTVNKAKISSGNSQTIGRNGELPLVTFLNKYLPNTLKAVHGHFLTPENLKSPQIDVMIIDTRYPYLTINADDSVLVMSHSVLLILEIKTNLRKIDIKKTSENFTFVHKILEKNWINSDFLQPKYTLVAYHSNISENNIFKSFFEFCQPEMRNFDIQLLRENANSNNGILFHFEPIVFNKSNNTEINIDKFIKKDDHILMCIKQKTPLSDLYYSIIQESYYILDARNYSLADIGSQFNEYLNWSSINNS